MSEPDDELTADEGPLPVVPDPPDGGGGLPPGLTAGFAGSAGARPPGPAAPGERAVRDYLEPLNPAQTGGNPVMYATLGRGAGHFVHDHSAPPVAKSRLRDEDAEGSPPPVNAGPEEEPRRLFKRTDRAEQPPA